MGLGQRNDKKNKHHLIFIMQETADSYNCSFFSVSTSLWNLTNPQYKIQNYSCSAVLYVLCDSCFINSFVIPVSTYDSN